MTNPMTNQLPDPFNLEAHRAEPPTAIAFDTVLTTVPVRRPGRSEFFRVHPDPAYVIDSMILEHESGMDRLTYWVALDLRQELAEELKPIRLFTCISKVGVVFLWPAKLPSEDGANAGRSWHISALQAADEAKHLWVKMFGNKALGAYEYVKARGDLGEPQWPDKTYQELIRVAFKERVIDSLDHPVIRELNGEI